MNHSRTQHEKAEIIAKVDELMALNGMSQNKAAKMCGVTGAQVLKWRRLFKSGGLAALRCNYQNCGRKPSYCPTPQEVQGLREYVLKTDPTLGLRCNKILAAQLFAQDARCSDKLRAILESLGLERKTLPLAISRAMQVRKSDKDLIRGKKRNALEGIFTPRDLTWFCDGKERTLLPGDIWESDDMSINGMFYVPWDSQSDPCAKKFGVRVFRAQLLPFLDIATGGFVAYSLVLRESDAYKAEDIRWALNHLFKTVGVPKVLRFEHGSWCSHAVEAIEKDLNVCRIVHAKTAKGKIIEGRFNQLQRILALNEVHLGRHAGEFEEANSDWMAYRQGRRDPRKELPSLAEQTERLDAAFNFLNSKPINGENYNSINSKKIYNLPNWIPQQLSDKFYLDNPRPRKPDFKERLAILPLRREVKIRHGMAKVTVSDFDGVYYFHHEKFAELGDGWPIAVCFDPADPDEGAGIISLMPTDDARNHMSLRKGEFICKASSIERVPQVVIGECDAIGFARAKRHAKLAHQLFREIIPAYSLKRGSTVHDYKDGTGDSTRIEIGTPAKRLTKDFETSTTFERTNTTQTTSNSRLNKVPEFDVESLFE